MLFYHLFYPYERLAVTKIVTNVSIEEVKNGKKHIYTINDVVKKIKEKRSISFLSGV